MTIQTYRIEDALRRARRTQDAERELAAWQALTGAEQRAKLLEVERWEEAFCERVLARAERSAA